ncbi:MAG: peptidoglycan-binding protein [Actinomycetota bacterium]
MTLTTDPDVLDGVDPPSDGRERREVEELVQSLRAGRRHRRWPVALLGAAVGAGLVLIVPALTDGDDAADGAATELVELSTVAASTMDLVSWTEYGGTLGFGDAISAAAPSDGTVTWVAPAGTTLNRGNVIAEVDGEPIFLWYGDLPAWQDMDTNTDVGNDVLQVEENLTVLGYDLFTGLTITVDGDWTSYTTEAVELLQSSFDIEETGELALGSVLFVDGPVTVDSTVARGSSVRAGSSVAELSLVASSESLFTTDAGVVDAIAPIGTVITETTVLYSLDGIDVTPTSSSDLIGMTVSYHHTSVGSELETARPVLSAEATAQRVTVDVDADTAADFVPGMDVEIELADETIVSGTVEEVASMATPAATAQGQETEPVVQVTFTVLADGEDLLEGPVTVRVTDERIDDATVVPVRSLVALAEGGYAVEIADDAGATTTLVGVELGSFQDGMVEITNGAVAPGQSVVVPT